MNRAGSDESWARALNDALDHRDAARAEVQGARAIIIALVHKFGPFHLTPQDVMTADGKRIDVATGPDGFHYRAKT